MSSHPKTKEKGSRISWPSKQHICFIRSNFARKSQRVKPKRWTQICRRPLRILCWAKKIFVYRRLQERITTRMLKTVLAFERKEGISRIWELYREGSKNGKARTKSWKMCYGQSLTFVIESIGKVKSSKNSDRPGKTVGLDMFCRIKVYAIIY